MAVRLRLKRCGKKKTPRYRIVAIEGTYARDGKELEILGYYSPQNDSMLSAMETDRIQHWLKVGAKPTDAVHRLLATLDLVKKIVKTPKNPGVTKKQKKEKAEAKK